MATFTGTSGDDVENGTASGDGFFMNQAGDDTINAGDGNDSVKFDSFFTGADTVDGGAGYDNINLAGDYTGAAALVMTATTLSNVEALDLAPGYSYEITTNDASVDNGSFLTLGAAALAATDTLTFDASSETAGQFYVYSGAGHNDLTTGAGNDRFFLTSLSSSDRIDGGGGYNQIDLQGDFSTGLVLDPGTLQHINVLNLNGANVYNIVSDDSNFASVFDPIVVATDTAVTGLIFDGSDETDSAFQFYGCGGFNILIGGARPDTFTFGSGLNLRAADRLDGQGAADTLVLNGDYFTTPLKFTSATIRNIETIVLAGGHSYRLTENNGNVAAGHTLTLDATLLGASDTVFFDGSAEKDGKFVLLGGTGADTFALNTAGFLGGAIVNGGSGSAIDELVLTTAATLKPASFLQMSHIEVLALASGANNITLNNALFSSVDDNHLFTVIGGSGDDIVTATAVTAAANRLTVIAGLGTDALFGGKGADTFSFVSTGLTSADLVNGGLGPSLDVVLISNGGTLASDAFAQVTHIEQIQLSTGNHALTLTDALFSTADDAGALSVIANTGADTIDATGVTAASYALTVDAGSGNDVLGGAEADTFLFAAGSLNALDTVNGGAGAARDQLKFTSAGTITSLAGVSHIEQIVLANGSNSITLTDALIGTCDSGQFDVLGGAGNDSIFALAATAAFRFMAGGGNDNFFGGAGSDTVELALSDFTASDNFTGGNGADTLVFDTAGAVSASALSHLTGFETIRLGAGTNSIALTTALVNSAGGGVLTVLGNSGADTIDGHAVLANAVVFSGGGGADLLTAGNSTDTFAFAAVSESTGDAAGAAYDTIAHFNALNDRIDLVAGFTVNGVIANVASGALSSATFDADLAAAVAAVLTSHTAVTFHASSGTLSGHVFLVVNPTGSDGYVSGSDYVFDITGYSGTLTASDFI